MDAGVTSVVILPDHDEPGRRHAEAVARSCHTAGLRVQVLPLPGLSEKQDVSDWLDAGHNRAELLALAEAAPAWEPESETQRPASAPTREIAPAMVAVSEDEPRTDGGNAHRLVARHGHDLRYVPQWRTWLVWDGRRWQKDSMNRVTHFAKETIRALYLEAATVPGDERPGLAKHAIKSEASGRIAAMVQLAESDPRLVVAPEALDADPFRLTVENGTLDLKTGTLQPHRRDDLCTKLAPVAYDPEATCPQWLAMLGRIMAGDTTQIAFVQKALGYALTGEASEQCFFLLYGRGANGKSTVIEVLRAVMGDYAMATAPETLLAKSTSGGANNDIAMLQGARFVSAVETDQGRRIAEALVKQATGGDRLTARFLYGEFFEFPPTFKLFLATNHKPVIRGTDHAMWRRVRLIPFEVQIPEQDRDRHLASKIKAAELPGVLNWLTEGCRAWQTDGLTPPERVLAATAEYREEQDVLGRFLAEASEENPAAVTLGKDLYAAYEQWCRDVGERPLTMREFNAVLDERGTFTRDKGKQGVRWYGVAVNPAYLPLGRVIAA